MNIVIIILVRSICVVFLFTAFLVFLPMLRIVKYSQDENLHYQHIPKKAAVTLVFCEGLGKIKVE